MRFTHAAVASTYRWQGRVEREREVLLLIKTTTARLPEVEQTIQDMSTYELPEVLAVPVETGSKNYLGWLLDTVRAED